MNEKVKHINPRYRLKDGRGVLCAIEGIDGAGKTTHVKFLHDYIRYTMGFDTVMTREPGGTPFSENLRTILFDGRSKETSKTVQALLVSTARRDHVERVIMPAIKEGKVIFCDRFFLSTMMYQRGADDLDSIIHIGAAWIQPHVTLLFDVDPLVGLSRTKGRNASGGDSNWLDNSELAEVTARRDVSLAYANSRPLDVIRFDANKPLHDVQEYVASWMNKSFIPMLGGLVDEAKSAALPR